MVACVYILLVLIPVLRPRPRARAAARLHVRRAAVLAAAGRGGRRLGVRLDGGLPARPRHRRRATSPHSPAPTGAMIMFLLVVLFVIVGDFIDAVPAIIIFMPIINKLTEVGNINPLHMGVVIITTLVFGLITPPYGLSLLVASKYVGVGFGTRRGALAAAVRRVLRDDRVRRSCSRTSCCGCPSSCCPNRWAASRPHRRRVHLPAVASTRATACMAAASVRRFDVRPLTPHLGARDPRRATWRDGVDDDVFAAHLPTPSCAIRCCCSSRKTCRPPRRWPSRAASARCRCT